MAKSKLVKNYIIESTTKSQSSGADFFYIAAKSGYHLVSAMITLFSGSEDIIIGISWVGTQYAAFTKAAPSATRSVPVMLVWAKNQ